MSDQYAIAGLRRKRDAIAGKIAETEIELQGLFVDLGHVDGALRLLQPDAPEEPAPAKPPRKHSPRGSLKRPLLAALRTAETPLSTRDLAIAVLRARGKPALRVGRETIEPVRNCLRILQANGVVRAVDAPGEARRWELVS